MKKTILLLSGSLVLLAFTSCEGEVKTVKIGNQEWMTSNLNVSVFRNGDSIPEVKTDDEWGNAGVEGKPACCYYDNEPVYGKKYGKLYNWYAVNDPRGLAPEGWHIPSDTEWKELEMALGMSQSDADDVTSRGTDKGSKLKAIRGWDYFGGPGFGTNESGFSALPGSKRSESGYFYGLLQDAHFWSSTEVISTNSSPGEVTNAWSRWLTLDPNVIRNSNHKGEGHSVRCVRDSI